jgi:hypothetical protein
MYMSFRGIYLASLSALTLLSKLRFSGPGIDEFGYHALALWFYCSQKLLNYLIIYLSIIADLSVHDEGYSRNTSCTMKVIPETRHAR